MHADIFRNSILIIVCIFVTGQAVKQHVEVYVDVDVIYAWDDRCASVMWEAQAGFSSQRTCERPLAGRYVTLIQREPSALALCDVQVLAVEVFTGQLTFIFEKHITNVIFYYEMMSIACMV